MSAPRRIVLVHHFLLPAISGLTVTLAELVRLVPAVDARSEAVAEGYDRFTHPDRLVDAFTREHADAGCVVGLNLHIEVGWEFTLALAGWCRRAGKPLYLYVHDYWPHHRDAVAVLTETFGARLLAITPAIVADLAAEGFAATLVPAGIAVPTAPVTNGLRNAPRGPATIGAVGRLVPRKRFPDVVGAFCTSGLGEEAALFLRVLPSLVFSPEQDRQRLDEIGHECRRCEASTVTIEHQATMGTDYTGWALYVSASEYEGVSMTPLEAVIQGCPFVLSDIPPHRRIVDALFPGERGELLFGVGDRYALAELLRHEVATGARRQAVEARAVEIHGIVEREWSLRTTARALTKLAREVEPEGSHR